MISSVDPPVDSFRASVFIRYFDSPQNARIKSQDARPVLMYHAMSPDMFSAVRPSDICHIDIFNSKIEFSISSRLMIAFLPFSLGAGK